VEKCPWKSGNAPYANTFMTRKRAIPNNGIKPGTPLEVEVSRKTLNVFAKKNKENWRGLSLS